MQLLASCALTSEWALGLERFLLYRDIVLAACAGLFPCAGMPFPASDSVCTPLFCLSTAISGPQISVFQTHWKGSGSFHCSRKWGAGSHIALNCIVDPLAMGSMLYQGLDLVYFPLLQ